MYEVANMLDDGVSDDLLRQLAAAVIKNPTNREAAAIRICGGDLEKMQRLMHAATSTTFTELVLQYSNELSPDDHLKNKTEFSIEVQDKMSGMSGKLWLEAAKFYAQLRGFTETASTTVNVQNVITIPAAPATLDEWQNGAMQYSDHLQNEAKQIDVS